MAGADKERGGGAELSRVWGDGDDLRCRNLFGPVVAIHIFSQHIGNVRDVQDIGNVQDIDGFNMLHQRPTLKDFPLTADRIAWNHLLT